MTTFVEAARRDKLDALRAHGIEPFAYRFDRTATARDALAAFREYRPAHDAEDIAPLVRARTGHIMGTTTVQARMGTRKNSGAIGPLRGAAATRCAQQGAGAASSPGKRERTLQRLAPRPAPPFRRPRPGGTYA